MQPDGGRVDQVQQIPALLADGVTRLRHQRPGEFLEDARMATLVGVGQGRAAHLPGVQVIPVKKLLLVAVALVAIDQRLERIARQRLQQLSKTA